MTLHDDEAIAGALRALAATDEFATAPMDNLIRRGRAARARRVGIQGVASLGVVAGLTAALATGTSTLGPLDPAGPGAPPDTSSGSSFHMRITAPPGAGGMEGGVRSGRDADLVIEGAYDPASQDGYFAQVSGHDSWNTAYRQTIVGGTCYTDVPMPLAQGGGSQWQVGGADPCFDGWVVTTPEGSAANPSALLKQLIADGSAQLASQSGTGAHEVDVWSYTYTAPSGVALVTLSGTITVDVSTQYVTRMTQSVLNTQFTNTPTPPPGATDVTIPPPYRSTSGSSQPVPVTYDYYDYGVPFTVTAPSAVKS